MTFFPYDEHTRNKFDAGTQAQLSKLASTCISLELREISGSSEWCIRVTLIDKRGEELRLAALGDTVFDAAERMERMIQGYPSV